MPLSRLKVSASQKGQMLLIRSSERPNLNLILTTIIACNDTTIKPMHRACG